MSSARSNFASLRSGHRHSVAWLIALDGAAYREEKDIKEKGDVVPISGLTDLFIIYPMVILFPCTDPSGTL